MGAPAVRSASTHQHPGIVPTLVPKVAGFEKKVDFKVHDSHLKKLEERGDRRLHHYSVPRTFWAQPVHWGTVQAPHLSPEREGLRSRLSRRYRSCNTRIDAATLATGLYPNLTDASFNNASPQQHTTKFVSTLGLRLDHLTNMHSFSQATTKNLAWSQRSMSTNRRLRSEAYG